jgi:hypothetical protein
MAGAKAAHKTTLRVISEPLRRPSFPLRLPDAVVITPNVPVLDIFVPGAPKIGRVQHFVKLHIQDQFDILSHYISDTLGP